MDCIDTPAEFEPKFEAQYPQLQDYELSFDDKQNFTFTDKRTALSTGRRMTKDVGATILLLNLARHSGYSAALEEVTSQDDATALFMAANGMIQQESGKLNRLKTTATNQILGPRAIKLKDAELFALWTRLEHEQVPERFYRCLLQAKLSAELESGQYSRFIFWHNITYSGEDVLGLTDLATGIPYYCTLTDHHLTQVKLLLQHQAQLEQIMRSVLPADALQPEASGAAGAPAAPAAAAPKRGRKTKVPLPWTLFCLYPDSTLSSPEHPWDSAELTEAMKRGLKINFCVERYDSKFSSCLEYAHEANLPEAPQVYSSGQRVAHLELPAQFRLNFAKRGPAKPLYLHLFYALDDFERALDESEAKARQLAAYYNGSANLFTLTEPLLSYDEEMDHFFLNHEGCQLGAQDSITWLQATNVPWNGQEVFSSYLHCELSIKYFLGLQKKGLQGPKGNAKALPHGAVFTQLYAKGLFQALRSRCDAAYTALDAVPAAHASPELKLKLRALLRQPQAVLATLNTIQGRWIRGKLYLSGVTDLHRAIFASLGCPLDGSLIRTWEDWGQLTTNPQP